MTSVNINLNPQELSTIISALHQMPYGQVVNLLTNLQSQVQSQVEVESNKNSLNKESDNENTNEACSNCDGSGCEICN